MQGCISGRAAPSSGCNDKTLRAARLMAGGLARPWALHTSVLYMSPPQTLQRKVPYTPGPVHIEIQVGRVWQLHHYPHLDGSICSIKS
jgi:hypothetical protein